eukprot:1716782-Ditylum_brightwellii.AAC.1
MVRSQGGLLATYYRNIDFTEPILGNADHHKPPYHETPWCPSVMYHCDSTRLDQRVSFDWGDGPPLMDVAGFPMDSFSVKWTGEIKAPTSETYSFSMILHGGVKLVLGSTTVIDALPIATSETISGSIYMEKNRLYPITIEYIHSNEEARIQLMWATATIPSKIIPSSAFFYTRHLGNALKSP